MAEGDAEKAVALLKKMCIRHDDVSAVGYALVAGDFGVEPQVLLQAIRDMRKAKNRQYMKAYMRRRRGSRREQGG